MAMASPMVGRNEKKAIIAPRPARNLRALSSCFSFTPSRVIHSLLPSVPIQ